MEPLVTKDAVAPAPSKPQDRIARLVESVRRAARSRHFSPRTEQAYVGWVRRFILFHGKWNPAEMGEAEISRFLSSLATEGRVSASTQNQALSALLFLYQEVLRHDLEWLQDIVRAKRPIRPPVVLTRDEVDAILGELRGSPWPPISTRCSAFTSKISNADAAGRRCQAPWSANTRTLPRSGAGNGSFRRPGFIAKKGSRSRGTSPQARELSYAPPLVRHPPSGGRL